MTSVLPSPPPQLPPARPGTGPVAGRWVRVGVLTPRGRADVALPAEVPLAELAPMVRELVGGSGTTGVPQAWRFSGPAGGPLPPDRTLDELQVRDGELLHLGPARPAPQTPVLDDAAEAVAHAVREAGAHAGPAGWAGPAAAVLGTLAACAVLATVLRPDGAAPLLRLVAVATAAGGTLAALLVTRRCAATTRPADARTATGAALCAVPTAATAGLLALPPPPGTGAVLLAAAAAGVAAATGQALCRSVSPVLLAVAVAGAGTALAALARLLLDAPVGAVAAGLAAPALAAGPLLPRTALRLAGVPTPDVPTDAGGLPAAEQLLPGDVLTGRARLARGLHAGLLAGTAVPAAGGAAVAAVTGGWAGVVLLAVTAAVLLLRARAVAEPAAARVPAGTAVVAVAAAAVPVALALGAVERIGVAAGLLLGVAAGAGVARADPSPPTRRALDVVELVLTAAAVPAALAAMGLFTLVRGL